MTISLRFEEIYRLENDWHKCFEERYRPENDWHKIVGSNELGFGGACGVDI
jgi:hypothetical protein